MRVKRSFCNSENRIGSELFQVSEVFQKSWSLTIRLVMKRLRIVISFKIESAVDVSIHLMYYYLGIYTIQMNLWKEVQGE